MVGCCPIYSGWVAICSFCYAVPYCCSRHQRYWGPSKCLLVRRSILSGVSSEGHIPQAVLAHLWVTLDTDFFLSSSGGRYHNEQTPTYLSYSKPNSFAPHTASIPVDKAARTLAQHARNSAAKKHSSREFSPFVPALPPGNTRTHPILSGGESLQCLPYTARRPCCPRFSGTTETRAMQK